MGHNGPIATAGSEFTVLEDGTVMQEGIIMGRIGVGVSRPDGISEKPARGCTGWRKMRNRWPSRQPETGYG